MNFLSGVNKMVFFDLLEPVTRSRVHYTFGPSLDAIGVLSLTEVRASPP